MAAVVLGVGLLAPAAFAAPARVSQAEALARAFPGARIERQAYALTAAQVRTVERAARARLGSPVGALHRAWRGDTLAGTAWFESRVIRTLPAVVMVVVAPDTTVERVEILAFHEPSDYRPMPRWLGQYQGRRLDDRLWPARGIRPLAGATLTSRALTESVRLALALVRTLAPAPAPGGAGR